MAPTEHLRSKTADTPARPERLSQTRALSSPYLLAIHGRLVIVGCEPDGDSVRFLADDPSLFACLQRGYRIRRSPRDGSVQLRLEAIDAPELHYGSAAQPDGDTARDWLMQQLGFRDLTCRPGSTTVTSASSDSVRAVIYSKASDPNGRPISYLQLGGGRLPQNGSWAHVTTAGSHRVRARIRGSAT